MAFERPYGYAWLLKFYGEVKGWNNADGRKLAVDIPSGLDADTGRASGPVFRADLTATMGAWKSLSFRPPGPCRRCGLLPWFPTSRRDR